MRYSQHVSKKNEPRGTHQQVKSRADQVENNAGGFVFKVTKWEQLDRFLILGSESGTFYTGEHKLTVDNAKNVIACIKEDGVRVVNQIVAISTAGRAAKNDPAIFALALVVEHGSVAARSAAYAAITRVCRIGTHLFHFLQAVQDLKTGWSRGLRSGVAKFYTGRTVEALSTQLVKYRQRDGWTHADAIRLSHPKPKTLAQSATIAWALGKESDITKDPGLLRAYEEISKLGASDVKRAVYLIENYDLPREAVPTPLLNSVEVWEALLKYMPITAMIRNLGKMTSMNMLAGRNSNVQHIMAQLGSVDVIRDCRVHPMALLQALKVYQQGRGDKGSLSWTPNQDIVTALDNAFYLAFQTVEPTGKNIMLAIDCSGSMFSSSVAGMNIDAATASGAMALVTEAVEKESIVSFFTDGPYDSVWKASHGFGLVIKNLQINAFMRVDEVLCVMQNASRSMGGTNCAVPMLHATKNKLPVDTFVIYTDNETWAGKIKPHEALEEYRQSSGRPAKLVVVATTATPFTIADPTDSGMLDVVGFDTSAPAVISDFSR